MDVASTCGDTWSSRGGQAQHSSAEMSSNTSTSATCGNPAVDVPVLSNSGTLPVGERLERPTALHDDPRRAAREMPATTAIGHREDQRARRRHHQTDQRAHRIARDSHATPATANVTGMKISGVAVGRPERTAPSASRPPAPGERCPRTCSRRRSPPPAGRRRTRVHRAGSIWSPSGRSDGRDSPVSADSSSTAGHHQHAVDRDNLSGLDEEAVARPHLLDRTDDQLASFVSRDHLGSPVEEGGELTAGPAVRVRLQRAPAREHRRDHRARRGTRRAPASRPWRAGRSGHRRPRA